MDSDFSRRRFTTAVVGWVTMASPLLAAVKKEDKSSLPVIPKRVEKAFLAPGKRPNALDGVPDGLWILGSGSI